MTGIILVRHGATDYNMPPKRIQGQCQRSVIPGVIDQPLNNEGVEEAQRVAHELANGGARPTTIISSPLLRAEQTASIIAQQLGLSVVHEPDLMEMFFGETCEGLLVDEFAQRSFDPPLQFVDPISGDTYAVADGKTLRGLHKSNDPRYALLAHPGGESRRDVCTRAIAAIRRWKEREVLPCFVTHGALTRFVMEELFPHVDETAHLSTGTLLRIELS